MTAALRAAINSCGINHKALERATGVERMSITKFAKGEQSLRLDKADRLAKYFGIEVIKKRKQENE